MIGRTVAGTSEAFLFHQADSGCSAICDGNSSAEAHSSYWVGMRLVISEAASCSAVSSTQVAAARISPQKSFLSQHWAVGSACPVGTRCPLHYLPSFLLDSNPFPFSRCSH